MQGFGSRSGWLPPEDLKPKERRVSQYLFAFHWSLGTLTGLADGQVPENSLQSFFAVVVEIVGRCMGEAEYAALPDQTYAVGFPEDVLRDKAAVGDGLCYIDPNPHGGLWRFVNDSQEVSAPSGAAREAHTLRPNAPMRARSLSRRHASQAAPAGMPPCA